MSKETHKSRLLNYFEDHKSITSLQSIIDLGNTRLAVTICTLRKEGHKIETTFIEVDNRWGTKTQIAKYIYNKPGWLESSIWGNLRRK